MFRATTLAIQGILTTEVAFVLLSSGASAGGLPMKYVDNEKTSKGAPIVHMWDCPRPDPKAPAAGYPVLKEAQHVEVYHATKESGGYSHHAKLAVHNGIFYAMWSNHPHGEDAPGQIVRFAISGDGRTWSRPQQLFPRYGEIGNFNQKGPHGSAAGWIVHQGTLYGLMGLTDCVGYANSDRSSIQDQQDAQHAFMVRERIGMVARSANASGPQISLGPIFTLPDARKLLDPEPLTRELVPLDGGLQTVADALHSVVKGRNPMGNLRAVDTPRPCEPVYYRARDGNHVCLLRDDAYSHRMYVSVSADAKTWPAAQPTDIPDSPSLSDAVVLEDGTVLLIGNQMAPKFDNPQEVSHYGRDPLMVSVSVDGYLLTRAYALRTGEQKFRVPNVGGRSGGGQYPSGLVYNGRLYVLYSMGKEDIWCSSVQLCDLGLIQSSDSQQPPERDK